MVENTRKRERKLIIYASVFDFFVVAVVDVCIKNKSENVREHKKLLFVVVDC